MGEDLFETVMVPIADPDDARQTARAIREYLGTDSELIITHVVPKGEGVPDKASVEQRQEFAEEAYGKFVDELGRDTTLVTPVTLYGRDVAETVVDGAIEADASIIAFTPRDVSGWTKLIGRSITDKILEQTEIPILVLPSLPENAGNE